MSKNKIILCLGICLALMPFLGLPLLWKTVFYVAAGLILILMAFIGHMRRRSRELLLGANQAERRI